MVCIWYLALFAYAFMYAIYECYGFCVVAFSEDIHSLLSLHWYKISKRQLHDQLRSMFTIPNTFWFYTDLHFRIRYVHNSLHVHMYKSRGCHSSRPGSHLSNTLITDLVIFKRISKMPIISLCCIQCIYRKCGWYTDIRVRIDVNLMIGLVFTRQAVNGISIVVFMDPTYEITTYATGTQIWYIYSVEWHGTSWWRGNMVFGIYGTGRHTTDNIRMTVFLLMQGARFAYMHLLQSRQG